MPARTLAIPSTIVPIKQKLSATVFVKVSHGHTGKTIGAAVEFPVREAEDVDVAEAEVRSHGSSHVYRIPRRCGPHRSSSRVCGSWRNSLATGWRIWHQDFEGMMLIGAFTGVVGAFYADSIWIGILCSVLVGAFLALRRLARVRDDFRGPRLLIICTRSR